MRKITKLIIHCAATPSTVDVGVAEIRRWHTDPPPKGRGWADIGYHFVIRRDGRVENGRPVSQIGAHAKGHNANSIGICMVGGVEKIGGKLVAKNNFTFEQWRALETLIRKLLKDYPGVGIIGHRDVERGKECPSFSVRDWLADNMKINRSFI